MKKQKNAQKSQKNIKDGTKTDKKPKGKAKSALWLFSTLLVSTGLLLFCQFFYGDTVDEATKFYDGTTINGVDVSGLNKKQAENVVSAKMLDSLDDVHFTFTYNGQEWQYKGSDFEVNPDLSAHIQQAISYGHEGNILQKMGASKKIKQEGYNYTIPYSDLLIGLDRCVEDISAQVSTPPTQAQIIFSPDAEVMFTLQPAKAGVSVDREKLSQQLKQVSLDGGKIEIPTIPVLPEQEGEIMIENIAKLSQFSTNYANSSTQRKNNVRLALSKFNGLVIAPGQEVSFNSTTGARNEENGYQKANIIKNGVFVEGSGGGVCQSSTTLYNALLLAGAEIVEVHSHSLPVSYVSLSRDAMVSEGYADLVFKNSSDSPIYIKTSASDDEVSVEIYGQPREDGQTLAVRSELVDILPHNGDRVVEDYSGKYSNFVLYKGEYHRIKYPKEGYESKAYLQYIKDGHVQSETLVRHDYYWPQDGVVVEGSEKLGAGMSLPAGNFALIPAQKVTPAHLENMKKQFNKTKSAQFEA